MAENCTKIAAVMSASPDATMALGRALAPCLAAGDVLALKGDLGAGKSTFARSLITAALAGLGLDAGDVPSPTFTLVQNYPFGTPEEMEREIWHIDCWRLETPADILELGFEDVAGRHVALIEWPEKMAPYLPADALTIAFDEVGDGAAPAMRQIRFLIDPAHGGKWQEKLIAAGLFDQ